MLYKDVSVNLIDHTGGLEPVDVVVRLTPKGYIAALEGKSFTGDEVDIVTINGGTPQSDPYHRKFGYALAAYQLMGGYPACVTV